MEASGTAFRGRQSSRDCKMGNKMNKLNAKNAIFCAQNFEIIEIKYKKKNQKIITILFIISVRGGHFNYCSLTPKDVAKPLLRKEHFAVAAMSRRPSCPSEDHMSRIFCPHPLQCNESC
jgi:hypothetical protein